MNNRAGLIERHLSANTQGEIGSTYDTTQDVAPQGVFVSQPKVGQRGRFVLRNGVTINCGVRNWGAKNDKRRTNGGA